MPQTGGSLANLSVSVETAGVGSGEDGSDGDEEQDLLRWEENKLRRAAGFSAKQQYHRMVARLRKAQAASPAAPQARSRRG